MAEMNQDSEVAVSRDIAAPADKVWALISDVTRVGEWSPETTACKWLGDAKGPAVGARFAGTNRIGKKAWTTGCTVVECVPGASFAFEVKAGPFKIARWSYRIIPDGDSCSVTETWTDRRGPLATKLGKPVSGVSDRATHNREGMQATLAKLATVAQS